MRWHRCCAHPDPPPWACISDRGRCEEALAFYKTAIGAEVNGLRRWKDSPDAAMKPVPGFGEKVTNASSRSGDTAFMANDGPGEAHAESKGMTLAIEVADGMEAERVFTA